MTFYRNFRFVVHMYMYMYLIYVIFEDLYFSVIYLNRQYCQNLVTANNKLKGTKNKHRQSLKDI